MVAMCTERLCLGPDDIRNEARVGCAPAGPSALTWYGVVDIGTCQIMDSGSSRPRAWERSLVERATVA